MAVYKRGYQRYQGSLTGRMARILVLPRFAWQILLSQRLVVILLVASLFWPLACIAFVYLSNHLELLQGFGGPGGLSSFLAINAQFFVVFMNAQAIFAIILAAVAGPSLIAPDLANGALPLYFSRPISRWEYLLSRFLVLVGILSPVTWIPGMLLFVMQWGLAGWTWFKDNWFVSVGIFAGFLLWIVFVALVAMASSAYVKWRIVAGALVLGFFFVSAGASAIMSRILRADWPIALNPAQAMNQIWRSLLGAEASPGPGAFACLATTAGIALVLLFVLERKIRPVEVVS